ncbi:MAG: hypothetical protein HQL59_12885 [Magnetococcales bacterium]|nr:hypothetical protein [Magnetococcales bacterium]
MGNDRAAESPEGGEEAGGAVADDLPDSRELERRQALEQWLGRVPDDPGGLLRRKFAREARRRR